MLRNLLATAAMSALLASGAMAQDTQQPSADPTAPAATTPAAPPKQVQPDGYLATNIVGESVYDGMGENAQNIGKVNDIVIDKNGQITSVVVGVGGFLGIGEKNVAVDWKQLSWAEQNGDRWLVAPTSKDALQSMPDFDRKPYEPAPSTAAAPADQAAPSNQTASGTTTTQPDTMQTGAIDKSTLTPFDTSSVRAEDLVGTTVYGADDAKVGQIGDAVLSQDGKVDAIIIDVGGFLGIGAKEVAIGMDKLSFLTDKDGNKYLYTNLTKDQLNAQPAYDKTTWAEKRDEQRLLVR